MATYKSQYYGERYLELVVTEGSVDSVANTSVLYWTVTVKGYPGYHYLAAGVYLAINGTKVLDYPWDSSATNSFPDSDNSGVNSKSGSITITHNASGEASVNINYQTALYYSSMEQHGGTFTCTKIDRASPTVTLSSATAASTTSLTLSGSSNVNCDRWDYSIDGSAWTNYSTTSTTSTSKTVTGLSSASHTVKIRARKTVNQIYAESGQLSVDLVAPTVSFTVSEITVNGAKISATASVACNIWQYSLDGGSTWTSFSTTSSTSATVTLSGLAVNTSYTVNLRARKTSNNLYGSASSKSFTTLGNTKLNSVTTFYPDNEAATTVTYNRTNYVATYKHRLEIKNGNDVIMFLDGISYDAGTANATIDISTELRETLLGLIPSTSKTYSVTLSLTTYDSYEGGVYGTQIGPVSTATLTLGTTQENSGPTLTASVVDINATTIDLTGDSSKLVRNASTALCTLSYTTRNNATIVDNEINNIFTTSYTYNKVSISSFVFYIRDSRGYELTQVITPTMIEYTVPTCVASAERVSPVSSNQVYLLFSGRYYNGYFGETENFNTLTVGYRYKSLDEEEYSQITIISNDNVSTTSTSYTNVSSLISSDTFNYTKAYNLRMIVSDRINTVITDVIITKGVPVFDWGENDFEFHVPTKMTDLTITNLLSVNGIDYTITQADYHDFAELTASQFSILDTYEVGDFVIYDDNVYECVIAVSTPGAWNAANWRIIPDHVEPTIQTLSGTRWVMNETLNTSSMEPHVYNLSGTVGSYDFSYAFEFWRNQTNNSIEIYLDDVDVPYYETSSSDPWGGADVLRDITITGGTDVTNETLMAWFENNATLIPDSQSVISLYNTQWVMNSTIPDTPKPTVPSENYYIRGSFGELAFNYEIYIDSINGRLEIFGDDGQDTLYENGAWVQDDYRTISINGLTASQQSTIKAKSKIDIRDVDLIAWFERNGTLISE